MKNPLDEALNKLAASQAEREAKIHRFESEGFTGSAEIIRGTLNVRINRGDTYSVAEITPEGRISTLNVYDMRDTPTGDRFFIDTHHEALTAFIDAGEFDELLEKL